MINKSFQKSPNDQKPQSKINEHIRNSREIRSPSQTRLHQILSERINSLERQITRKQGHTIQNTEQKRNHHRPNHKHQRIPNDAERKVRDVERKSIGTAMETTVRPNEPSCEANQKGGANGGKLDEPEWAYPNRAVTVGVMARGAAKEEDGGDCEGNRNGDGDGERTESSLGLGVFGFWSGFERRIGRRHC